MPMVLIPLDIASYIVAWVLAIISRVKYKNRFSLILIIIYGSLLALSVIGIIVLFCIFMGLFQEWFGRMNGGAL